MRVRFPGIAVLALVIAWGAPAIAHHSNPLYFDMSRAVTLEGKILRVEMINPHILLFLESKNEKGELVTWILQGSSLSNAERRTGLKERLQPGISIAGVGAHRGSGSDPAVQRRSAGIWQRRADVLTTDDGIRPPFSQWNW